MHGLVTEGEREREREKVSIEMAITTFFNSSFTTVVINTYLI